ncbi:methyltransferase domain-containing protein [Guyparkeria halophila]|uniref:Methyltransferase domain-containing protein n=1 Tax=Guyparkeria halophila TaxID=47960 RepID=A0A6I6CYQ8_9GAMM|nr:class I SAM-dependent methyltransferase [Guyparkeria halophila]QGT77778.1 methyltransferase domain-containing protein [Guyparkeria halophila]
MGHSCPLCGEPLEPFATVPDGPKRAGRTLDFLDCPSCRLVVRDPAVWPSPEAEADYYRLHENRADDAGYRHFLVPAFEHLVPLLGAGVRALDFGCGPDSALIAMASERGVEMVGYDPQFHPDPGVFERGPFDVITCTETVEHLHRPAAVFDQLERLLRPGGRLIVQTGFVPHRAAFGDWHYRRDPTHVILFRTETFERLAAARGWQVVVIEAPVAVFEMPGAT